MTRIKDKLLWDYLDGKLDPGLRGRVSRIAKADKAVEERLERIRVLDELIRDHLHEHISAAPANIAEGVTARWFSVPQVRRRSPAAPNGIVYVFLGVLAALAVFGGTVFKGVLKYAYADYPGIKSLDPAYIYAALASVTVVVLIVMVFDLMILRKKASAGGSTC